MLTERFDLNDIDHEPTDIQLESLMKLVADEAGRRAELARQDLMRRLRADIAAANQRPVSIYVSPPVFSPSSAIGPQ